MNTSLIIKAAALISALAAAHLPGIAQAAPVASTAWTVSHDAMGAFVEVAASPDGAVIFAAGTRENLATVSAYRASDGTELWRFVSQRISSGDAIAVSEDGQRLVLAGSVHQKRRWRAAMWAFDTADGSSLWAKTYSGTQTGGQDGLMDVVFGTSRVVYSTGHLTNEGRGSDLVVYAHDARSGVLRWRRMYDSGRAGGSRQLAVNESGGAVRVSEDGRSVIVSGSGNQFGRDQHGQVLVLNLKVSTGALVWVGGSASRVNNRTDTRRSVGSHLVLSGNGAYVAGWRGSHPGSSAASQWRFSRSKGKQLWQRQSPETLPGVVTAMVTHGDTLFTSSAQGGRHLIQATATATGSEEWASDGDEQVGDLHIHGDADTLYAAGSSRVANMFFLTLRAIDPGTGSVRWSHSANQSQPSRDMLSAHAMTLAQGGTMAILVGHQARTPYVFAVTLPDGTIAGLDI